MRKIILTAAFALAALSITAKEKTVTLTVSPAMSCMNCVNKIKSNIRFVKGVKKIDPSLKKQLVTINYDDVKGSEAEIIKGFEGIGYSVTVVKQDSVPVKK